MARKVRSNLGSRSWRLAQPPRRDPYWQQLELGLSVGYYRTARGGDGTWWGRLRIGTSYRIEALEVVADDHADANGDTVLNWAQAQAAVRTWAARQTAEGPLTVEAAGLDYVADLRARKGDRAAREMLGRFRKHVTPVLGDRRLADLTATEFRSWFNGLVRDGDEDTLRRSKDTANRLLGSVKAAFNLAFNDGRVADDRAWRRVGAFKGVGEARKVILSEAEQQRLIEACGPGLREFALLTALTGARPGRELTEARVRDFDEDRAMLRVSGKTGGRDIHLQRVAVELVRRLASGKRPGDYLLTTAAGAPWTKSLHKRPVDMAVKRAGLDSGTSLYALRHSYISGALKAGVPIKAVADHCGTSIPMIQRYYAKFIPTDLARYAEAASPNLQLLPDAQKVVTIRKGLRDVS